MNSIKAITQLEDLKRDRLSFVNNDELDEVFLNDIKAISLAIKALKKCPDIKDKIFNCRMCGKELKTWKSIQKGFGTVCEKRYLEDVYNNQQIKIETLLEKYK
mgnify:CR=1 FL=1